MMDDMEWDKLSPEEKRRQLFLNQKGILDGFLKRGAISQAQYNKSFGDLMVKMGFNEEGEPICKGQ